MNEILINVLIVFFYVLILAACGSSIAVAIMLVKIIGTIDALKAELKQHIDATAIAIAAVNANLIEASNSFESQCAESHNKLETQYALMQDGFRGHVEASKGMLQFLKDGFDGNFEIAKQVIDASAKHSETIMKLDTDNSQKLYDTMVVTVQMMNLILTGLGYQPRSPEEGGLKDIERGTSGNYGKPPAPKNEEGLTYPEK